jgi:hypothetical protein
MKTYLVKLFVVLLLTLACAFTASANETYHKSDNGNHKRFTQKITHSVTHNGNHNGDTHHNDAKRIQ